MFHVDTEIYIYIYIYIYIDKLLVQQVMNVLLFQNIPKIDFFQIYN